MSGSLKKHEGRSFSRATKPAGTAAHISNSEHLLVGILREDGLMVQHFVPSLGQVSSIREEIEAHTEKRKSLPATAEIPLSTECRHILNFAIEEADGLGHRHIGNEHLLAGILREERCFAARILEARGADLLPIRKALAKAKPSSEARRAGWQADDVRERVAKFLNAWNAGNAKAFSEWFNEEGLFVDTALWQGPLKIQTGAALHFTSRAAGATNVRTEEFRMLGSQAAVATAIFEPAPPGSAGAIAAEKGNEKREGERIRMTVTLVDNDNEWLVAAAHATTIQSSSSET